MSDYWVCDIHNDNGEGSFNCTLCYIEEMAEARAKMIIVDSPIGGAFYMNRNLVIDRPMCIGRPGK